MTRLVSVFGAGLLALAVGCGGSSNDDDGLDATIDAEWSYHTADGDVLDCPADFDTAEVTAFGIDTPDDFTGLFDCTDIGGSLPVFPADYDVQINIIDDGSGEVYASSLTIPIDVLEEDGLITEDFIDDGGRFVVDWNLVEDGSNTALSCEDADADGILVTATFAGSQDLEDFTFDCDGPAGISNPLPAGDYTVSVVATDIADQPVGQSESQDSEIDAPNVYTDLGTVDLLF